MSNRLAARASALRDNVRRNRQQPADRYPLRLRPAARTEQPDLIAAAIDLGWTIDSEGRWHEP